jgi:hypothetical protein
MAENDLLAQLQELKRQRAALDAPEVSAVPAQSFGSELAGGQSTIGGNIGQWAGDILKAPYNAAQAIGGGLADTVAMAASPFGSWGEDKYFQMHPERVGQPVDNSARGIGESIFRGVGQTAMGVVPGGSTAFDYLADAGTSREKTGAEYGKQLRGELSAAPMILAGPALKAAEGGFLGVKDKIFGAPEKVLLGKQSINDEIFANKLGYATKNTPREQAALGDAADYSGTFARENPVAGIDNSLPGREQINQFQKNLGDVETKAINLRENDILPKVAAVESQQAAQAAASGTPYKQGIAFEDIPLQKQTQTGTLTLDTLKRNVGDTGVDLATEFVQQKFGIQKLDNTYGYEGAPVNPDLPTHSPSFNLSAQEANNLRKQIDAQISEIGGYDQTYWLQKNLDPSVANGYAEGLRFYRQQLDQAVKGHIGKILGEDVATQFTQAGENISMSKTYSPMIDRFKTQTGQAYTPPSGKQVPAGETFKSGSNIIDTAIGVLDKDAKNAKMQAGGTGLEREGNAIRQLQQLVEFRNDPSLRPAPRGWAQIKSSAQDLMNVGNIAIQLGLISSVEELSQMPDAMAKQVVGIVASQAPQAFAPTPDKVNVIDGEYQNPMEKDGIAKQALGLGAVERARILGASFENKYEPLGLSTPPVQQKSAAMPDIGQLNSMLSEPTPQMPVRPTDAMSMVDRLNAITAIHDLDVQ